MAAKETKEKAVVIRLNTISFQASAEYLIGVQTSKPNEVLTIKEPLRAICYLVSKKGYQQGQTGIQEVMVKNKAWEFFTDDYFTDHECEIPDSSYAQYRVVGEDESIYENYLKAIESHKEEQIKLEAEAEANKKLLELKKKGGNREQRRKTSKKQKEATH